MLDTKVLPPGATIGVLGNGQLGRMLAFAARRMGYRIHAFGPETNSPAGQVADRETVAAYDDLDAVRAFAKSVDAVTFEFENVSAEAANAAAQFAPVRPGPHVLHIAQNRAREKNFLQGRGLPVAPFAVVGSLAELHEAIVAIGCPCVLKTAGFGYDGKGQTKINKPSESDAAWNALGGGEAVLEAFVDFELEISVIIARGTDGAFAHFGVIENAHENHILDMSVAPALVPPFVARRAVEVAREIADALEIVGVLCVEMFVTTGEEVIVNEIAPRPHNSGHLTIEACQTSQFEQQLRAVCNLPLGGTDFHQSAAMTNLLGDLWLPAAPPNFPALLAQPGVHLHLYGKAAPRPGRKMGHVTVLAPTPDEAAARARLARVALGG